MIDFYRFALSPWFWAALTVVFALIELASSFTLTTIWFAISAFLMIFVTGFTGAMDADFRFRMQIVLFLVIAIVLLVFTRPIAIKKFKVGATKTNVDAVVGREALVTRAIAPFEKGEVKIGGQMWTAVSADGAALPLNTVCIVERIEGVKAVVHAKIEEE
jgi:membrane protein implicated in regulation of membrane protease activity